MYVSFFFLLLYPTVQPVRPGCSTVLIPSGSSSSSLCCIARTWNNARDGGAAREGHSVTHLADADEAARQVDAVLVCSAWLLQALVVIDAHEAGSTAHPALAALALVRPRQVFTVRTVRRAAVSANLTFIDVHAFVALSCNGRDIGNQISLYWPNYALPQVGECLKIFRKNNKKICKIETRSGAALRPWRRKNDLGPLPRAWPAVRSALWEGGSLAASLIAGTRLVYEIQ